MAPTAFPIKLWNVVNSENGLITWADDGTSILVNENCFDSIVNKRHPNFLRTPSLFSLRRSLRWYNFVCSENEGLGGFSRYWHPYFMRDREDLLSRVTIGKKRALVKSWLENRLENGLSYGDEEYSSDMQLSAIAMTSGNSILPSSFRQQFDFVSSDCALETRMFPGATEMCSGIYGRHSQKPQDTRASSDTEEASLVKDDFLHCEVLPSTKYLPVDFNSALSTGSYGINSFATDACHPVLYLEIASGNGDEGDMEARTFGHNDISYCYANFEEPQCPRSGEQEELMGSSCLGNITESELFCGLSCLEDFALSGVPVALNNGLDTDQWLTGETRSYFAL